MLSEPLSLAQLREWAASVHSLTLTVPLDAVPRVQALHCGGEDAGEPLEAELVFSVGEQGRPKMAGRVSGELRLECQRCLQPVGLPLTVAFSLLCLADERELDVLQDFEQRFDTLVVPSNGLDLAGVLEDEILASLPLAPKHRDLRGCGIDRGVFVDGQEETSRPFAGLAGLMRPNNRDKSGG